MSKKTRFILFAIFFSSTLLFSIQKVKPYLEERLPPILTSDHFIFDLEDQQLKTDPLPNLNCFSQEFHYIGHGEQSIVFASQDNQYVLKFFLNKRFIGDKRFPIPKPTHWIPSHRKTRKEARQNARMKHIHQAMIRYLKAFEKMADKTGIISLHLVSSKGDLPSIQLIDHNQQKHLIDLNRASFVLQHKAELLKTKLRGNISQEERTTVLSALSDFFEERAKKGFMELEKNPDIEENYGILNGHIIQFDVGKIEYVESLQCNPTTELLRMKTRLDGWTQSQRFSGSG